MNKSHSHTLQTLAIDIVNISAGLLTWILPNISTSSRVIISLVLITILIVLRVNPKFTFNLSVIVYVVLILAAFAVTFVEFIVMLKYIFVKDGTMLSSLWETEGNRNSILIMTFQYALTIALPVELLGFYSFQENDSPFKSTVYGCQYQFYLLGGLILIFGILSEIRLLQEYQYLMSHMFGFIGPIALLFASWFSEDTVWIYLFLIGGSILQTAQFALSKSH